MRKFKPVLPTYILLAASLGFAPSAGAAVIMPVTAYAVTPETVPLDRTLETAMQGEEEKVFTETSSAVNESAPEDTEAAETEEKPAEASETAVETPDSQNETTGESVEGIDAIDASHQSEETKSSHSIDETMEGVKEDEGNNITLLEPEPALDADGNVTLSMYPAEDVALPLTVNMRGSEGEISFTVQESGQQIKMKPDTYKLTKAIDGNGEKLPDGATLEITDEGGYVYLDFTKPEDTGFSFFDFIIQNLYFLPVIGILYLAFRWFIKHYIN